MRHAQPDQRDDAAAEARSHQPQDQAGQNAADGHRSDHPASLTETV
jgi:hypothetical protein